MSAPDEKVRIRIEAPASWDRFDIAQAVLGPDFLLKADRIKTGAHTWHRCRPMHEAHDAEVNAYHELLLRMVEAIQEYVEQHVVEGRLGKSDSQWILISPEHFDEIRKIIGDYHEAYVAGLLNPALLKPGELQRLIDEGIVAQDLKYVTRPRAHEKPAESVRSILQAYEYGRDLAMEPHREAQTGLRNTSYDAWNARAKQPLSPAENEAVRWSERHAAQYVRGLGNRIADATGTIVVDHALRQKHEEEIRDAVTMNTWKRESWRKIITDITDKTGDYARDYGRIAATEKQRAMQEGQSRALTKRFGSPKKVRVAKQPAPDACEHCVALHLTAGRGSVPKIFTLAELTANGTNVGRKARDWRAVVGPVHPWCACELIHVPDGWSFDDEGNLVPESLKRADLLTRNLQKALNYTESAPTDRVHVQIADPFVRAAVERVVAETPPEVFTVGSGVTMITTDIVRTETPLNANDYAYWTANEIRLMQTIPHEKVDRVIRHEIGHSLNVWAVKKLGSVAAVRAWHTRLWKVSQVEGFVSTYARKEPIENAAEATRLYLYDRSRLMLRYPRTFAFLHRMYRDLIRGNHAHPEDRRDPPKA